MAHAVTMIVALTVKLSITERVRNALPNCFTRILRPRAVGLRVAQGYANLRVWVPNASSCQWMMTLNLGHDVSEYVFVYLA